MADKNPTELINITGANTAAADELVIWDADEAGAEKMKAITRDEFLELLGERGIWVPVSAASASASSQIDFTGLSAGWDYKLDCVRLEPTTDGAALYCRLSQSATFSSSTDYAYESDDGAAAANQTQFPITAALGNVFSNEDGFTGEVILTTTSAGHPRLLWQGSAVNNAGSAVRHSGAGYFEVEGVADGIRLFMSSSTIASGAVRLSKRKHWS